MNFRNKKTTKGMALTVLALVVGAATLFAAVNAVGTIFAGKFELGPTGSGVTDILGDGSAATGPDWSDKGAPGDGLFNSSGFVAGTTSRVGDVLGGRAAFVADDISAGGAVDATVYSGGPGDKNIDPIADWTWATSSVPVKDDVGNSYAYIKDVTAADSTIHTVLLVGGERLAANGDSHIDIEFFQAPVSVDREGACPNGKCKFIGSNTDGDLLVNMDFTNGGGFGTLTVRKRHEGVTNNYDLVDTLSGEGCNPKLDICGFNNGASIPIGGWPSYDNHGASTQTLVTNAFTEFGLDITALGFGKACFSSIQVKTRSSQSFTATLKDFTLSHFQDCVATIATQIHDGPTVGATHVAPDIQIGKGRGTINVGDTIHDKAIVTGQAGFPTPTGSVRFFRFDNDGCSGTPANGPNGETATITQISAPTPSAGGQAAAESLAFKAALSGAVSFQALYLGDSNYIRVTPPSECEVVIINKLPSRIITDILLNGTNSSVLNRTLAVGSTVVDEATVYGLGGTGIDPTGSVTFARFANANCSGTAALTETKQITADGAADGIARVRSSAYSASNAGGELVCFKATYSGDNVYLPPDQPSEIEPICVFNTVPKPPAPF